MTTTFGVLFWRSASINYRSLAHPVRNILTHSIPKNIKNPDLVVRLSTFSLRLEGLHTYRVHKKVNPTNDQSVHSLQTTIDHFVHSRGFTNDQNDRHNK